MCFILTKFDQGESTHHHNPKKNNNNKKTPQNWMKHQKDKIKRSIYQDEA